MSTLISNYGSFPHRTLEHFPLESSEYLVRFVAGFCCTPASRCTRNASSFQANKPSFRIELLVHQSRKAHKRHHVGKERLLQIRLLLLLLLLLIGSWLITNSVVILLRRLPQTPCWMAVPGRNYRFRRPSNISIICCYCSAPICLLGLIKMVLLASWDLPRYASVLKEAIAICTPPFLQEGSDKRTSPFVLLLLLRGRVILESLLQYIAEALSEAGSQLEKH